MSFTLEKTAAGLIRSLLVGSGREALEKSLGKVAPLITETGVATKAVEPRPFLGLFGRSGQPPLTKVDRLVGLKDHLIGRQPIDQLSQRIRQGGLFGHGGVMHSTVAMPEELAESVKHHGYLKGLAKKPMESLMHGANLGMVAGLPAFATYQGIKNHDRVGLGGIAGETLGWGLGWPFGIAGGMVFGNKGRELGQNLMRPSLPPINLDERMSPLE